MPLPRGCGFPARRGLWALRHRRWYTPVGDLAFRWCGTYRAQGRSPFHSLEMAHCHSFFLWTFLRTALPSSVQKAIAFTMLYRGEECCSDWEFGFKPSGLTHTVRTLHHLLLHIFGALMLLTHAPVPSAFRLSGSVMIQDYSSTFFSTALRIHKPRHATHRTPLSGGRTEAPLAQAKPWTRPV